MASIIVLFGLSVCFLQPVFAEETGYSSGYFDWLYLSNTERSERVTELFNIMFPKGYVTHFPKKLLREKLEKFLKDPDYKIHYDAVCAGYTQYKNVNLQPFRLGRTRHVYMYALQYQDSQQKTFYYDALGRLKFVDFRYGDFPQYPFYTKKYAINGKLVRAMYLQTPEIMYIYSDKGSFIGVKYKNTVYGFNYTK